MQSAQDTFLSSTFWSERIGFVAALETLNYMEKNKTYLTIKKIGLFIKKSWAKLAKRNNIEIEIFGIDSILNLDLKKS